MLKVVEVQFTEDDSKLREIGQAKWVMNPRNRFRKRMNYW